MWMIDWGNTKNKLEDIFPLVSKVFLFWSAYDFLKTILISNERVSHDGSQRAIKQTKKTFHPQRQWTRTPFWHFLVDTLNFWPLCWKTEEVIDIPVIPARPTALSATVCDPGCQVVATGLFVSVSMASCRCSSAFHQPEIIKFPLPAVPLQYLSCVFEVTADLHFQETVAVRWFLLVGVQEMITTNNCWWVIGWLQGINKYSGLLTFHWSHYYMVTRDATACPLKRLQLSTYASPDIWLFPCRWIWTFENAFLPFNS